MKKPFVFLLALTCTLAGFFASTQLNAKAEPKVSATLSEGNDLDKETAHSYSVGFRQEAATRSMQGQIGFFEITEETAMDLVAQIKSINQSFGASKPSTYRCIFGQERAGSTFLMVVALGRDGREYENNAYMRKVDGYLPCPNYCDINGSAIIMGDASRGQDENH